MSICPSDSPGGNFVDKNALIVLKADLTAQMTVVKAIAERLEERARGLLED